MNHEAIPPVSELIPHEAPMILIDTVLAWDSEQIKTRVDHRQPSLFADADHRVPVWVGVEYMAQSVAAWSGLQQRQSGRPIEIGYLLGTRNYDCSVHYFEPNQPVLVHARQVLTDEQMIALFECSIVDVQDQILAQAAIKVAYARIAQTL